MNSVGVSSSNLALTTTSLTAWWELGVSYRCPIGSQTETAVLHIAITSFRWHIRSATYGVLISPGGSSNVSSVVEIEVMQDIVLFMIANLFLCYCFFLCISDLATVIFHLIAPLIIWIKLQLSISVT